MTKKGKSRKGYYETSWKKNPQIPQLPPSASEKDQQQKVLLCGQKDPIFTILEHKLKSRVISAEKLTSFPTQKIKKIVVPQCPKITEVHKTKRDMRDRLSKTDVEIIRVIKMISRKVRLE